VPQDHLVIQLAIDPRLDGAFDVCEIHDHVPRVQRPGGDVDFDRRVVTVQVPAHAVVVEKAMAVTEVETFRDAVHLLLVIDYWLFEGPRRDFLGLELTRASRRARAGFDGDADGSTAGRNLNTPRGAQASAALGAESGFERGENWPCLSRGRRPAYWRSHVQAEARER